MSRLDVVAGCEDFSSQSPKGSAESVTSGFSEKKDSYVSAARKPAVMNSTSSTFTTKWTNEAGWLPISDQTRLPCMGE